MVIELFHDLFHDRDFKPLNLLIQLCTYKARYGLYTDLFFIHNNETFKRLDAIDREILTQSYNEAINKQSSNSKVIKLIDPNYVIKTTPNHTNTSEPIEFNLDEALYFLNQPVSVVLENSLNDAYFIQAIIYHFDNMETLKKHLDNRWIQFENLGGCTNMENFLNAKLSSLGTFPKDPHHYLRCFILLDSDRHSPQKKKEHKHGSNIHFLRKHKISHHILEKRNMENYMPVEVFKEWEDEKLEAWAKAYAHLSEQQKDFFNINIGFSKKNEAGESIVKRNQLELDIQKLYENVTDANYRILDRGFKLQNFKREFPRKFTESPNVNRVTLSARLIEQENPNEILEILQKINDLL